MLKNAADALHAAKGKMNSPRDLQRSLLEYIEEQAKETNPNDYRLSSANGFVRRNTDLAGLPGLEYDMRPEGDHIWLHLPRLEAYNPPVLVTSQR